MFSKRLHTLIRLAAHLARVTEQDITDPGRGSTQADHCIWRTPFGSDGVVDLGVVDPWFAVSYTNGIVVFAWFPFRIVIWNWTCFIWLAEGLLVGSVRKIARLTVEVAVVRVWVHGIEDFGIVEVGPG